ncbi:MAG: hypothetical protein HFG71_04160 [Hungatella sp.]|jgi:serine/threonine protein phosphatase PrpC|nr:hypothetical protein [Hungatella sp.]
MRKLNSQFITTFVSEAGLNGQNGTYYGFVEMDRYYCMAVAEGYDRDGGLESAKLAVDTVIEAFVQKPGMTAGRIRACLKKAHRCLKEHSVRVRLKAGILLLVSDYTRFRYGVCGNVMLYAFRNAGVFHQSATHTVYQAMADQKKLSGEDAGPKEETRNLYHYLGGSGGVTVSGKARLEDGDMVLVATEGFWNRINRVEVLDAYESIRSVEEFLGDLQELYLRGSTEDIPCCCLAAVEIKKAYKENTALKKKLWLWSLVILLILAVGGTILAFYLRAKRRRQEEIRSTAAVYEDTGDRYIGNLNSLLAKQEYEKAAEESKKLDKNEERLERERLLSEKINISVMTDSAGKSYEARDYAQARDEYKSAMELAEKYEELVPYVNAIGQRMKLVSTGLEIDNYMESAALKEAAGDMETAGILYKRAEAMLRIVDDAERLKEVQLALLRVKEEADQEAKDERAKARDEVIIDADKAAALDAILAGDFDTALAQYTKIRDAYIAMEDNEKAEETTQIILSLQKQAREIEQLAAGAIDEGKSAAMDALVAGDAEKALGLYEEMLKTYLEMGDEAGAQEARAMIDSLKEQIEAAQETDMEDPAQETKKAQPESDGQEAGPAAGPGGPDSPSAPGGKNRWEGIEGDGQLLFDKCLDEALRATARQDYEAAMKAYREIENLYNRYGISDTTVKTEVMIERLRKLMEEGKTDG